VSASNKISGRKITGRKITGVGSQDDSIMKISLSDDFSVTHVLGHARLHLDTRHDRSRRLSYPRPDQDETEQQFVQDNRQRSS
jgi:hypothetical protein